MAMSAMERCIKSCRGTVNSLQLRKPKGHAAGYLTHETSFNSLLVPSIVSGIQFLQTDAHLDNNTPGVRFCINLF